MYLLNFDLEIAHKKSHVNVAFIFLRNKFLSELEQQVQLE
jgi:hypothetical protein